ncbi:hypothetical protein LCGC14_2381740, partial [marine sediment metagenome]
MEQQCECKCCCKAGSVIKEASVQWGEIWA